MTLNVASPEAEVRSRIVSSVQVSSPDGRKWVVSTARTHRSWNESRQTAFFWAHVVVTAIMVVLFVVVFRADWSRILELLIPLVLALWLFGFVAPESPRG